MKASELRLGNWVQGEPFCIPKMQMKSDGRMRITGQGIAHVEQGILSVYPIPLTPEILEKCGFEKVSHMDGYSFYSYKIRKRYDLPNIAIYPSKTILNSYPVRHLQYVHELQNLHYATSGIELTITL